MANGVAVPHDQPVGLGASNVVLGCKRRITRRLLLGVVDNKTLAIG